ncbi:flavin-containing monooxygenase 5-like [Ptychodera flava]|uniref:flavin-containing monooxygenase 5-like n=1 Tax=Ptychodera flava TaxID=63121 RepID=UPI003969C2EC
MCFLERYDASTEVSAKNLKDSIESEIQAYGDTGKVILEKMKVSVTPIEDVSAVSAVIASHCEDKNSYWAEVESEEVTCDGKECEEGRSVNNMSKRVAVIGAGASGLTAIKCCLDEGLEPVCFEKDGDIGGLWNYHEDVREGSPSVFRSTVANTSKENMSFSDFPPPKEFPNFMPHTVVMKYFRLYAEHFALLKYVKFNVCVDSVKPAKDYHTHGKWDVGFTEKETDTRKTETFDAVLVCSGHQADPHMAKFPCQGDFKGRVVHTRDYRHPRGYEDKRILVIGIGNSGCDAAVELARVGSQVLLSTRRGTWVINRANLHVSRAFNAIPLSLLARYTQRRISGNFNHEIHGLQPLNNPLQQVITVSDYLQSEISCGRIKIKANVKRFFQTSVEFEDGTVEEDIDEVIMATGYTFAFPFLDESIVKVTNNEVALYKHVFPPQMKHGTLAIIGLVQPVGATPPVSELQCRWATRVFKGLARLPSLEAMLIDIRRWKEFIASRFVRSQRYTIQVDGLDYMDEIATQIGVKPNIFRLALTNPKLAYRCFFGHFTAYQYRLMGPGKWANAVQAMETVTDRVLYPIKTRPLDVLKQHPKSGRFTKFCILIIVIVAAVFVQVINSS